jgi:uncharacterized lipoprotein YajG
MKNRKQKMNTKNTNMSTTNTLARGAMVAALAVAALGMGGCAITPATERLNYQAQTGVKRIAQAENITVNVVTTDSREKQNIGQKINTYGMKMAKISAEEPVGKTVENAIEKELSSRGYRIDGNSNLKVSADITKFYSDTTQGWWMSNAAEVNLAVAVNENGKRFYHNQITGKGKTKSYIGISSKDVSDSLEIALTDAMTKLFNDQDFIKAITSSAPAQTASTN